LPRWKAPGKKKGKGKKKKEEDKKWMPSIYHLADRAGQREGEVEKKGERNRTGERINWVNSRSQSAGVGRETKRRRGRKKKKKRKKRKRRRGGNVLSCLLLPHLKNRGTVGREKKEDRHLRPFKNHTTSAVREERVRRRKKRKGEKKTFQRP